MGGNERDNLRLRLLRLLQGKTARPIPVEPKRRWSGPQMSPSDWHDIDQQAKVAPQCLLCHERALPGMPPLTKGLCGPCKQRLDEAPEAA
jgi:hypothetical protein